MKRPRWPVIATGAVTLVLAAACGATAPDPGGAADYYPAAPTSVAAPGAAAPVVAVTGAALGPGTALVDSSGLAVYLFENDGTSGSTCGGTCAHVWPPVPAPPGAPPDGKLGSTPRTDGRAQLTYGGHPLYYYIGDHNPGDSNGQGLNQFGARWYLVQPNGAELGQD